MLCILKSTCLHSDAYLKLPGEVNASFSPASVPWLQSHLHTNRTAQYVYRTRVAWKYVIKHTGVFHDL